MKKRCLILSLVVLLSCSLSGCELLFFEMDGAAAGAGAFSEAGTIAGGSTVADIGVTNSVLSIEAEEATITEFKTIIRSDLNTDSYSLLKEHLTPGEFDVIEGMVRSESDVNSLLSKVRVARAGTSAPRLFIKFEGTNEGVEFAEVTTNQTIRLLRSGKEYSLPGELYTTNGNSVYLKDLQNYRVLAHINAHQVVLVLDEVPVNSLVKVRVGSNVGLLPIAALIAVSNKKFVGRVHHNYYNYKAVTCTKCVGKGRFTCTICSGSGNLLCPKCHGSKNLLCPRCSGSGKQTCTYCQGYGSYYCPDCHGTGRIGVGFCPTCAGKGRLFCKVCNGKGTVLCTVCQGREMIVCSQCRGYGNILCDNCRGQGYLLCSECHGTGVNWVASN